MQRFFAICILPRVLCLPTHLSACAGVHLSSYPPVLLLRVLCPPAHVSIWPPVLLPACHGRAPGSLRPGSQAADAQRVTETACRQRGARSLCKMLTVRRMSARING